MHRLLSVLRRARDTFWVIPAVAIVAAIAAGILVPLLDTNVSLPDSIAISADEDTVRPVLTAIVALGVSVAGVSFSVIAVALVLASQQLSPRVLRSFQRQRLNQAVLGVLLATSTYALFVLGHISDTRDADVPQLSVTVAMGLAAVSLGLFVVFLHHAIRSLNASAVIRRIAAEGHAAIDAPYPSGAGREPDDPGAAAQAVDAWAEAPRCVEVAAPRAGYVADVDGARICKWAAANDVFVEQRRGVGSFAVTGSTLALVRARHDRDLDPDVVANAFTLNEERLVEGDIAFPVRQLADVALKGLSPSLNDPTTAENAMDSIADTLVRFACRPAVSAVRCDADGAPRLRAIAPRLDELVVLGFDQVRRDAADRPSFAVRLLELLADVRDSAPAAADSTEIDRQAGLIADQAAAAAAHDADRQLITDAYERLHARSRDEQPSRPAALQG